MIRKISENLYYTGVNDRAKAMFENLWELPQGVSYNSYLLIDEKIALFDTVDSAFSTVFFQQLDEVLNGKSIDYLIINHMEPDHSGLISELRNRFPEIQIVGNARTADMLNGYYNITENLHIIKDGDEINLGKHCLKFVLTPMIHWPETMMTYETTTKTLFSGDAFGSFGALDGGIKDSQLNADRYWDEMIRYYSNIVGKYGSPVQKALARLSALEIGAICSTHGPVWVEKENVDKALALTDRLSRYETERGVVIVYGTMYGHTEQIAEEIAARLSDAGIKNIVIHNVTKSEPTYIIRDVFKYKGLIVGSPTYNNQLFPKIDSLLSQIRHRDIKNRVFAYFGSFTWAGAAVKRLAAFAEESGFETINATVELKQSQYRDTEQDIEMLVKTMVEALES
ncbi:MAG: FprA family A-type flavoprotein [Paludibacter sp.]|jgi:flavorubredoxin|nr:FprA family A-type flavoprotein [Paludibacter sp.]